MKKPELVIESKPDDDFLTGSCSACSKVRFELTGNTLEQKTLLRILFDAHFKSFHMRKNGSQADARIDREATEGKD
jgi:hypothetical protein